MYPCVGERHARSSVDSISPSQPCVGQDRSCNCTRKTLQMVIPCEPWETELQVAQDLMRAGYFVHSCRRRELGSKSDHGPRSCFFFLVAAVPAGMPVRLMHQSQATPPEFDATEGLT